ncbi:MAG: hypothetical protein ABSG52_03620 [Terriglobales bacterium]|jgi:hypothetical protein
MQPFDYVRQEWGVLTKAPLAFVGLAIVFFAAGIGLTRWYDSDKLNDKDDQLRRYRVALGIEHGSPNALVELTNPELRSKALIVSSRVQGLCTRLNKQAGEIKAQLDAKKFDDKGAWERQQALSKQISDEFHNDLRSDALNVQNELLRRLDPKAAAAVVRFPILADAATGTPVSLQSLLLSESGMDAVSLCGFAEELQQLAKLLPSR